MHLHMAITPATISSARRGRSVTDNGKPDQRQAAGRRKHPRGTSSACRGDELALVDSNCQSSSSWPTGAMPRGEWSSILAASLPLHPLCQPSLTPSIAKLSRMTTTTLPLLPQNPGSSHRGYCPDSACALSYVPHRQWQSVDSSCSTFLS
jgi:hypothetical protein